MVEEDNVRIGPCQKQKEHRRAYAHQGAHAERERYRTGGEERQREQVKPVQPVHARQSVGRHDQQPHRHREQGDADDVVEVAIVDVRRTRATLREHDDEQQRHERHQSQVREWRLLAHLLDQRLQRIVVGKCHAHDHRGSAPERGGVYRVIDPADAAFEHRAGCRRHTEAGRGPRRSCRPAARDHASASLRRIRQERVLPRSDAGE